MKARGVCNFMTEQTPKKQKPWKIGFIILAIINLLVILVLGFLLFGPVAKTKAPVTKDTYEGESSTFTVRTSKENLDDLVNAYIDNLLGDSEHRYKVDFDEDVHLIGELPVFSTTVPLSVHMEPIVQKNGDIVMKLNSISVGLLELPNKKIMQYIDKYLTMPEWVKVQPDKEEIYVALTDMKIKSNFKVKADKIDLEANHISFDISVPYETLGIENDDDLEVK